MTGMLIVGMPIFSNDFFKRSEFSVETILDSEFVPSVESSGASN